MKTNLPPVFLLCTFVNKTMGPIFNKIKEKIFTFRWRLNGKSKVKFLLILLLINCMLFILYNNVDIFFVKINNCHNEYLLDDGIPDVLNNEEDPPPKGTSIFFHETSCNTEYDKVIKITSRQACAVESAALHHPNSTIYLLYAAPTRFPNSSQLKSNKYKVLNELLKYRNIKIRRVNLQSYTKGTPLEDWYKSNQLKYSTYYNSHTSDVLRYLTLWRYGGTYLDLDVVVMKSMDKLPPNYAGIESNLVVAAGVINLEPDKFGHEIAEMCLHELSTDFKGDVWGHNGPGVISRVLKRICQVDSTYLMTPQRCKGFSVCKSSYFYPIPWKNWDFFFDPHKLITVFNFVRNSYLIHVWNKFSSEKSIMTRGNDVAYGAIARTHCPNVFRQSGDFF